MQVYLFSSICCIHLFGAAAANPDDIVTSLKQIYDFPIITIKDVVSKAFSRAAFEEGMGVHDLMCVRDYNARCPVGWAFDGAESCVAPENYKGDCESVMKFEGTALERSSSAMKCGAVFACAGSCFEDFEGADCPLGWGLDLDGSCVANSGYAGPCVRRKRFAGWSAAAKEHWASQCGVVYPCKEPVQTSASAICTPKSACPDGWSALSSDVCRASPLYNGPCSLTLDVSGLGGQEKAFIAERCGVSFCS